jgi:hypothetical protein
MMQILGLHILILQPLLQLPFMTDTIRRESDSCTLTPDGQDLAATAKQLLDVALDHEAVAPDARFDALTLEPD